MFSRISHHKARLLVTAATISSAVVVGTVLTSAAPVGAASGSQPATTIVDYLANSTTNINLSATGGVNTTILSLSLPAGSWVISSELAFVSYGGSDYARCGIRAGTTQIAASATIVGDPSLSGNFGPAGLVAGRGVLGSVKNSAAFTATLFCEHDHSNGSVPYVDAGATLWAHKSPGVNKTT